MQKGIPHIARTDREPLVRNRVVFYGLARPDLVFIANSESVSNYQLLATLFERALDEVEHVRDFISGSFLICSRRATGSKRTRSSKS
jgi:magnesium transporter